MWLDCAVQDWGIGVDLYDTHGPAYGLNGSHAPHTYHTLAVRVVRPQRVTYTTHISHTTHILRNTHVSHTTHITCNTLRTHGQLASRPILQSPFTTQTGPTHSAMQAAWTRGEHINWHGHEVSTSTGARLGRHENRPSLCCKRFLPSPQ